MTEGTLMLGVLWPPAAFKKKWQRVPKKKEMRPWKHNGKIIWGVVKDPAYGNPIGTILMTQKSGDGVRQTESIADSSTQVRGAQAIADIFNALRGNLAVAVSATTDPAPDGNDAVIKMKAPPPTEDDDLDLCWDVPMLPPASIPRPATTSSSSIPENGHGARKPLPPLPEHLATIAGTIFVMLQIVTIHTN